MASEEDRADTRGMAIVHRALTRDLGRVRVALEHHPPPVGHQRRAIGDHVVWLMAWLHEHHSAEDAGLWPLVRLRNPDAGPLLDQMEADHQQIVPAADELSVAGHDYASRVGDAARTNLLAALDQLMTVLVPHFEREVAEVMPVVAASITRDELDAHELRYHIKTKSPAQLAMEGLWLVDDLDPEGYRLVVGAVSPAKRVVLEHGFGWLYRRRARLRWQPPAAGSNEADQGTSAGGPPVE